MGVIRITTRCQMSCAHCGYSCTEKGDDMSYDIFRLALDLSADHSESVSLSGGEPTLHPDFWHMLIDCISHPNVGAGCVWLATNGADTAIALKLASLASRGVLGVDLSLDKYHNPIDTEVIEAFTSDMILKEGLYMPKNFGFTSDPSNYDLRGVRQTDKPIAIGRAKSIKGADTQYCLCDDIVFQPNGEIYACGCEDSPKIGDVWTGFEPLKDEDGYFHSGCHRELNDEEDAA